MEFKSQPCTDINQSRKLLELGLKKETADCMYSVMTNSYNGYYILEEDRQYNLILFRQEEVQSVGFSHYEHIPAWSLHRLLCLYGADYTIKEVYNNAEECYGMLISAIRTAIEEGNFNEDYLEEK